MSLKTQTHCKELRDMDDAELRGELTRRSQEQFEQRLQLRSGQLSRNHLLRACRREIARIKTLLGERQEASS